VGVIQKEVLESIAQGASVVPIEQELRKSIGIYKQAWTIVHNVFAVTKKGKPADFQSLFPVVDSFIESIQRNPDALVCFCLNKSKDDYLLKHAISASVIAARFSIFLGLDASRVRSIAVGALLNDLGKVFIPSNILYKQGRLTDEEFSLVRLHSDKAQKILSACEDFDEEVVLAVAQHHERFNGSGYPNGLKDKQISLAGQISAIADTYDAITSHKLYREARPATDALLLIHAEKDRSFSKDLINQFIHCIGLYPVGTLVALNNGNVGVVFQQNSEKVKTPMVRQIYNLKAKRMLNPLIDVDLSAVSQEEGIRILCHVPVNKFSFNPLSAIA